MLIEEYFARIRNFVNSLVIVQKFELEIEARADYIGFIRGIVIFKMELSCTSENLWM